MHATMNTRSRRFGPQSLSQPESPLMHATMNTRSRRFETLSVFERVEPSTCLG